MQVGNLRHRITFQKKTYSGKDASGQDSYAWTDFDTAIIRSSSIKPIKGEEVIEARAVRSQVSISIMVRYDPEVALVGHEDRIVRWSEDSPQAITHKYAIHAIVNHNERDRWLEFLCSEGLQDQD